MNRKEDLWRQYLKYITNHPAWVIIAISLLTVFFAFSARNIQLNNTSDLWMPHDNAYVDATEAVEEVFGRRNVVVIGIAPAHGDIYQPEVLQKISQLHKKLSTIPEVKKNSLISLASSKAKGIHGTPEGMVVNPLMLKIPETAQEIASLKKSIAENPIYSGAIVSTDGKFAAIIAEISLGKDEIGYSKVSKDLNKVVDSERDSNVKLYLAGTPLGFAAFEYYTYSAGGYFGAAFLIIMLVQYLSFRSIQGMLLPMVTGMISVLWGLGVLGLMEYNLDVLNASTPILIMAIISGHAIQLLKRYYEEYWKLLDTNPNGMDLKQASKLAIIESLSKVGLVMVAAGLIASVTFFSLFFANVEIVRHYGLFASAGVLSGLILELTLIPALRSILTPPVKNLNKNSSFDSLDKALRYFAGSVMGAQGRWILLGGTIIIIGLGLGITQLQLRDSTLSYFGKDHVLRVDDNVINQSLGGTNSIYFLVESDQPDSMKDPRVLRAMEKLQVFLESQPGVGKTQSLADVIKRMNLGMHNDDPTYDVIPQDQATIAQYLFLYSLSGDPQDFDSLVDNDYKKSLIWTYVKSDSTSYFKDLIEKAQPILSKEFPPGVTVRVGGGLSLIVAITDSVVKEKIYNTAQMALIIWLLTSLMLRSFVGGLFVVIPVIIIVIANFGVMGWLGIPLSMGTATTASIAIGIGADFEIYMLLRFREEMVRLRNAKLASEAALLSSGKAILFVSLALIGGYSVLFISDFAFYGRLASAVIMTMAISALSAIFFLRAMIMVFRPKFLFGDIADNAEPHANNQHNLISGAVQSETS
jgi:uncharacterized protein